ASGSLLAQRRIGWTGPWGLPGRKQHGRKSAQKGPENAPRGSPWRAATGPQAWQKRIEPGDENQQRVERVLEQGLERGQTPEAAHAVVTRIERLAAHKTEAALGEAVAATQEGSTAAAADAIEHAAERAKPESALAAALATTAAETVAPTEAAPKVTEAAQA